MADINIILEPLIIYLFYFQTDITIIETINYQGPEEGFKVFIMIYCVAIVSIATILGMYLFGFIGE